MSESPLNQGEKQPLPHINQQVLAAMYAQEEDEIDLLAYWNLLWKKRIFIFVSSFVVALVVAGLTLLMDDIYRAQVLLAPVVDEGDSGSSALSSLGGLASLAGVSMGHSGNVEENLAVLKSREFLWKFVKDEKLMRILFAESWDVKNGKWLEEKVEDQPSLWDAYRLFEGGLLVASNDTLSGLVHIAVEWNDPQEAAEWANLLVLRLNEHLRQRAVKGSAGNLKYLRHELSKTNIEAMRQVLFVLIAQEQQRAMLANVRKQFAFRVLDPAVIADKKIRPKRALIVLFSFFTAGFLSVFFVIVREGVLTRHEEII